jgi:hypothetical protein
MKQLHCLIRAIVITVQTVVFEQNCLQAQFGAKNILQIPAQIQFKMKIV